MPNINMMVSVFFLPRPASPPFLQLNVLSMAPITAGTVCMRAPRPLCLYEWICTLSEWTYPPPHTHSHTQTYTHVHAAQFGTNRVMQQLMLGKLDGELTGVQKFGAAAVAGAASALIASPSELIIIQQQVCVSCARAARTHTHHMSGTQFTADYADAIRHAGTDSQSDTHSHSQMCAMCA